MLLNTCTLTIADLTLELQTPRPLAVTEAFLPFLTENKAPDVTVVLRETERLPETPGESAFRENCVSSWWIPGGVVRSFCEPGEEMPYAVARLDTARSRVEIDYLPESAACFALSKNCFHYLGFEGLLMAFDRLIFHACLVASPDGGLLFSGNSGIGKSTQGELWRQFGGGRVINGDRPILRREIGRLLASGSPYAGSSDYFVNETVPVKAIFFLEQGAENSLCRLGLAEAFRRLYAQTVVNAWNEAFVTKVCDFWEAVLGEVPVYRLVCTPEAGAVDAVRSLLKGMTES